MLPLECSCVKSLLCEVEIISKLLTSSYRGCLQSCRNAAQQQASENLLDKYFKPVVDGFDMGPNCALKPKEVRSVSVKHSRELHCH